MAVLLMLSFHCLLRLGEGVNLYVSDFVDCNDPRMDPDFNAEGGLRLRDTKTGPNQFVSILDAQVANLLRMQIHKRRAESPDGEFGDLDLKIFTFSAAAYRREFKTVCAELGLSDQLVPHSARHGGATKLRLVDCWPVEDIMERGRWASSKSARRYIQQGRALLCTLAVPIAVATVGRHFARDICHCVFGTTF
jgi:integrase